MTWHWNMLLSEYSPASVIPALLNTSIAFIIRQSCLILAVDSWLNTAITPSFCTNEGTTRLGRQPYAARKMHAHSFNIPTNSSYTQL
jgi:hypothetical protein